MILPTNQDSLADMQARVRRTKGLRLFFLLLMPIGFIVPCAIALLLGQAGGAQQGFTPAQAFGVAAFALPLIGLGLALDIGRYEQALAGGCRERRQSKPQLHTHAAAGPCRVPHVAAHV